MVRRALRRVRPAREGLTPSGLRLSVRRTSPSQRANLRRGRYKSLRMTLRRPTPIVREALLAAFAAASLAALLLWAGPAGERPGRPCLPAGTLPQARVRPLEQLLVRGPLLVRHLQPPLLPPVGAARDQGPRPRVDLRRSGRIRDRDRSRVGAGDTLVVPNLRRPLGGRGALGGLPVRARVRARPARTVLAAGRQAVRLCGARRARARREPPGVPVPRARARRRGDRTATEHARGWPCPAR